MSRLDKLQATEDSVQWSGSDKLINGESSIYLRDTNFPLRTFPESAKKKVFHKSKKLKFPKNTNDDVNYDEGNTYNEDGEQEEDEDDVSLVSLTSKSKEDYLLSDSNMNRDISSTRLDHDGHSSLYESLNNKLLKEFRRPPGRIDRVESEIDILKFRTTTDVTKTRFYVDPHSAFHYFWQGWIFILIMYISTVFVYVISFLGVLGVSSPFFWIDRFVDLCFWVDILLNFITGYYLPSEVVESNRKKISIHYLLGWFPVDFIASIPWDVIVLAVDGTGFSWLSLPRFLKLLRLLKLPGYLSQILKSRAFTRIEVIFHFRYGLIRIIGLFASTLLIVHILACLFHFVAAVQKNSFTWIKDESMCLGCNNNFEYYIAAYYFISYTLTTIGYGDIGPLTTISRIYIIMVIFFGAFLFSYVISAMSQYVQERDMDSRELNNILDQLAKFSEMHQLPRNLEYKTRRYLKLKHATQRNSMQHELLNELTPKLRDLVSNHIYEEYVQRSYILSSVPEKMLGELFACAESTTHAPGEYIFLAGLLTDGFYILTNGTGYLESKDGTLLKQVTQLSPPEGEVNLLMHRINDYSLRCKTFCETLYFPGERVMPILRSDRDILRGLRKKYALELWRNAISALAKVIQFKKLSEDLMKTKISRENKLLMMHMKESVDGSSVREKTSDKLSNKTNSDLSDDKYKVDKTESNASLAPYALNTYSDREYEMSSDDMRLNQRVRSIGAGKSKKQRRREKISVEQPGKTRAVDPELRRRRFASLDAGYYDRFAHALSEANEPILERTIRRTSFHLRQKEKRDDAQFHSERDEPEGHGKLKTSKTYQGSSLAEARNLNRSQGLSSSKPRPSYSIRNRSYERGTPVPDLNLGRPHNRRSIRGEFDFYKREIERRDKKIKEYEEYIFQVQRIVGKISCAPTNI